MADVITRFKLETTQFDSKLRDTAKALKDIAHQAELGGKDFDKFSDEAIKSARALGTVQSGATNTKDKLRDLVGSYNDAAKAYNSLTESAKKGEFGKAMSQSLTQLQQRIKETKQELYGLGDGMKGASGGGLFGGDKLSGMLQVFGGNVMTKIAGAGLNFVSELKDMVTQGIELARAGEGIRIAFERLNKPGLLDNLREATHGTVTDLELMKAAVKFNDFKLPVEELGTMLAFAQQKAKDTGQSVDYMVDSIVTGLGRKSLMILDNLGLSATEIRDKMKETGDMTKAVGEIIREQMGKAGDYIETAADRATRANVALQNKMEELGRKFLPVKQASDDLWTSIKIGILDIIGGPLANLLNGLTRAGQLRNELKNIGSDERVNSDIEKLKGSNFKEQVYTAMLNKYSREEQRALDNFKKAQKGGMGSIAIWENRYLARKAMREDFQSRGREVANGVSLKNTPTTPTNTITPTGATTTTKQPKTEIEKNQAKIKDLTQEYIKLGDQETEASKNRQIEIQKEIELLQKRNNLLGVRTEQAQGRFLGGNVQINGLSTTGNIIDRSHLFDTEGGINWQKLQKYNEQTSVAEYKRRRKEWESEEKNKNKNKKNSEYDKDDSAVSQLLKLNEGVAGMAKGLEQMGIELPDGFKSVINGIQGVLSMLESINTIVAAIKGLKEVGTFLGIFSHGGTVRAAQGYYVPGNRYSTDTTPILANAGELVLNKSSQNNLANDLKGAEALVQTIDRYQTSIMRGSQYNYGTPTIGGGMLGNMKLETLITGEQIRLVLNNNGRRTGRGEYITTNFK